MSSSRLLALRWTAIALSVALVVSAGSFAAGRSRSLESDGRLPPLSGASSVAPRSNAVARSETVWVFDADFEDELGDNAGWRVFDLSGTLGFVNYWHNDSYRAYPDGSPPDSSFWVGLCTDDPCWRQPCGYGNDWHCELVREFSMADTGASVYTLSFRQRMAMERYYEFGYVDVSTDDGASWTTILTVECPGFSYCSPQDWDSSYHGLVELDLSPFAGSSALVRWRFESDGAYSSQDQPDNFLHSVQDGAWAIDEIILRADGDIVFHEDCEPPDPGWMYEDIPDVGQTGVTWRRVIDPAAGEPPPAWAGHGMYVATDPSTGEVPEGQFAVLASPPMFIYGAVELVSKWDLWVCYPEGGPDPFLGVNYLGRGDTLYCYDYPGWHPAMQILEVTEPTCGWGIVASYPPPVWFGPDADVYIRLYARQVVPGPPAPGCTGVYIDRVRVGYTIATSVPEDEAGTIALHPPLPNPSRGRTAVSFILPRPSHARLAVYDLSGRVVRVLQSGMLEGGEHEVEWDGKGDGGEGVASGVYFFQLETPDATAVRKLVVVK